jgi:hypothetical protein
VGAYEDIDFRNRHDVCDLLIQCMKHFDQTARDARVALLSTSQKLQILFANYPKMNVDSKLPATTCYKRRIAFVCLIKSRFGMLYFFCLPKSEYHLLEDMTHQNLDLTKGDGGNVTPLDSPDIVKAHKSYYARNCQRIFYELQEIARNDDENEKNAMKTKCEQFCNLHQLQLPPDADFAPVILYI